MCLNSSHYDVNKKDIKNETTIFKLHGDGRQKKTKREKERET